jgi:hypothetical protein
MRGSTDNVSESALAIGEILVCETAHGVLRCVNTPAGTDGYDDLRAHAERLEIDGVETHVASLPDLTRMKEVSDRPKDRAAAEMLRALQRVGEKR